MYDIPAKTDAKIREVFPIKITEQDMKKTIGGKFYCFFFFNSPLSILKQRLVIITIPDYYKRLKKRGFESACKRIINIAKQTFKPV